MQENQLTKLEKLVLERFTACDVVDAKRLRVQIAVLKIESREYTNVGFKTTFSLPTYVPILSDHFSSKQKNVYADHPAAPAGAEFLLNTAEGKIVSLNGHVLVGNWPSNESVFHVLKFDHSLSESLVEAS